ncbi:FtsL-like putative cell division protein [Gangjinia marincola]|uniref:FtsL-like putative cell division protein n=1 Tax=Gangjinia marincola TaxID=578463 RepID=A0ABN1MJ99_9FLAO
MKEGIYNILKGKFLINDDALKNWQFILFCTLLAIIMIASSHSAERKVHEIAALNRQVKELRSQFVDGRTRLMNAKMESDLIKRLASTGVKPSAQPPKKILIKSKQ